MNSANPRVKWSTGGAGMHALSAFNQVGVAFRSSRRHSASR